MTTPGAGPEATKLMQVLAKLQTDMAALKAGASTQTLDNSAVEVTQGRGYIPIMKNGQEMHRIGRQPDGTITSVTAGSTAVPVIPNTPTCTPGVATVTVYCDGFGSQQYLDFSHINVYVDGTLTETLMKVPESTVIGPLTYTQHAFELSSVNLAGVESAHTAPVYATPNQVVSDDIAQGMITALQIANDAVTQAAIAAGAVTSEQIADATITANNIADATITGNNIAAGTVAGTNMIANTITSDQIAANAIQAVNIAAGAVQAASIAAGSISADKMAANSITTAALQAQAVTALQIAANAVTAGAIQAGSIDATKLAAQVILATTSIIAGSPTGQRIQLDPTGLFQIDAQGNLALQLGNTPGGNSLTVIDPTDATNALATIGADGSMSMTGISIDGTATLNGIDLVNFLNAQSQGVLAQGTIFSGSSPSTTSELGLFELSCDVVAGRTYVIQTDMVTPNGFTFSGGIPELVARITTNGSIPAISSTMLGGVVLAPNYNYDGEIFNKSTGTSSADAHYHLFNDSDSFSTYTSSTALYIIYPATYTGRLRILFSVKSGNGLSCYLTPFAQPYTTGSGTPVRACIIDQGLTQLPTGGVNTGGGSTSASGQYSTVWTPTYTAYYGDTSGNTGSHTDQLKQGEEGSTNWMCMLGFDYANILSTLSGATIVDVKLFLYSDYWALSSGGYACVGLHNASGATPPSSYSYTTRDVLDQQMKKPQGLYLNLPTSVGTALAAGTAKGLVLDARASNPGTSNLGTFKDKDYTDATKRPSLTITYTK